MRQGSPVTETFGLGRIAGLRIGANWSVAVIFILVLFGLAAGRFPQAYPEEVAATYWLAGTLAAVVFFTSLLAHELAHALVARRNGVHVEGIVLWMFGGVAKLSGESPDPRSDLRIAGVGPLVSVGLAVGFGAVAAAMWSTDSTGIWHGVFSWLGVINAVLALFNLAPAAPLDGGRILRALLWKRRGDRTSAAVSAAKAGRVFGLLLVGLGLIELVLAPGMGGIWLMLIGWFIITAAAAEEQHVRLSQTLGDLRVADVMTAEPTTVPAGITVDRLLDDYVFAHRYSAFPVVDAEGRATGLVTLNRIKDVEREARPRVTAEAIACTGADLLTVSPSTRLTELLGQLQGCADGRAVVVDGGSVIGVVTPSDISRALQFAELRA